MNNYWLNKDLLKEAQEVHNSLKDTICQWDFQIALAETIKEKYGSQWTIVEIGRVAQFGMEI